MPFLDFLLFHDRPGFRRNRFGDRSIAILVSLISYVRPIRTILCMHSNCKPRHLVWIHSTNHPGAVQLFLRFSIGSIAPFFVYWHHSPDAGQPFTLLYPGLDPSIVAPPINNSIIIASPVLEAHKRRPRKQSPDSNRFVFVRQPLLPQSN
jgi:hypothetical protein